MMKEQSEQDKLEFDDVTKLILDPDPEKTVAPDYNKLFIVCT